MGDVVTLGRPRRAAGAPHRGAAGAARLLAVMERLLGLVVTDRRLPLATARVLEEPRGGRGHVVVATWRLFGLAPVTITVPYDPERVCAERFEALGYTVAAALAAAVGRGVMGLEPPLAEWESRIRALTAEMSTLGARRPLDVGGLRRTAADLSDQELAAALAAELWSAVVALGQTALWGGGELNRL